MRSLAHSARRSGHMLVELMVAVGLLGIIGSQLLPRMSQLNRLTVGTSDRAVAQFLAAGTLERIRAAGPVHVDTTPFTARVSTDGVRSDTGRYLVRITRAVQCTGGPVTEDTPAAVLRLGCGVQQPVLAVSVLVTPPSGWAAQQTSLFPWRALGLDLRPEDVDTSPNPYTPTPAPMPAAPVVVWDSGLAPAPTAPTPAPTPVSPSPAPQGPRVTLAASSPSVRLGSPITFSATYTPGTEGLVSRQLDADGRATDLASLTITPTRPGLVTATALAVDAAGRSASAQATVAVTAGPLAVRMRGTQQLGVLGRGTWTATPEGGVPPYSYAWGVTQPAELIRLSPSTTATVEGQALASPLAGNTATVRALVIDAMGAQVLATYAVRTCAMTLGSVTTNCR